MVLCCVLIFISGGDVIVEGSKMTTGVKNRRNNFFKKGHTCYFKRQVLPKDETDTVPHLRSQRLTKEDFLSIVKQGVDGFTLEICDENNQAVNWRLLRPKSSGDDKLVGCTTSDDSPVNDEYRLYHKQLNENFWNNAISEHFPCIGRLQHDNSREKQVGIAWEESLHCTKCGYKSALTKLYKSVRTGSRGRPPAEPNLGLQIGLSQTPAGNSDARVLLSSAKIRPPSNKSLQQSANRISDTFVKVNENNMEHIRTEVKRHNEMRGNGDSIACETDCTYNIGLDRGGSRTPMQPATQVICTISENVTSAKKVVGLYLGNKHCAIAQSMKAKGLPVTCPNHAGKCTRNIEEEAVIGDEHRNVELAYRGMQKTSVTSISKITTDGDSRASEAINKVNKDLGVENSESLRDTRHLSEGQQRYLKKQNFSRKLLTGRTKVDRDKQLKLFSADLKRRCYAEFNLAHKHLGKDTSKLKEFLKKTSDAVLSCYSGECGEPCSKYSFACTPNHSPWQHSYLMGAPALQVSGKDKTLLKQAIGLRLGPDAVEKTKYNTNTQKSEANNRSIRRVLPKNVLRKRNASGRLHGAIHRLNNGIDVSALTMMKAAGMVVNRQSSIVNALQKDENRRQYHKKRKQSDHYRQRRKYHRERIHKMYMARDDITVRVTYAKGLMDAAGTNMKEVQNTIAMEHGYAKKHDLERKYNLRSRSKDVRSAIVDHDHMYA